MDKAKLLQKLNWSIADRPWHRDRRWIYAMQMQIPGHADLPIKIGIASDVMARLNGIQTSHAYPLKLLGYFPAIRDVETEKDIHELFSEFRIRTAGEWFVYHETIPAFIAEQSERFEAILGKAKPLYQREAAAHKRSCDNALSKQEAWDAFSKQGVVVSSLQLVSNKKVEEETVIDVGTDHIDELFQKNVLISPATLAQALQIDVRTLYKLARQEAFSYCQLSPRTIMFTRENARSAANIVRNIVTKRPRIAIVGGITVSA